MLLPAPAAHFCAPLRAGAPPRRRWFSQSEIITTACGGDEAGYLFALYMKGDIYVHRIRWCVTRAAGAGGGSLSALNARAPLLIRFLLITYRRARASALARRARAIFAAAAWFSFGFLLILYMVYIFFSRRIFVQYWYMVHLRCCNRRRGRATDATSVFAFFFSLKS